MFPIETVITYTLACLLLVVSPGPDNLLAIGRGISQGKKAALVSGFSSGAGILFHVLLASLGLTMLIQTSNVAFFTVKILGAVYLVWLGIKVLRSRALFSVEQVAPQSLRSIFTTGFLSAALNPKPGLFVLAFVPQFIDPQAGAVIMQLIVYGSWFALLTALGFSLMGICSTQITQWLTKHPRYVVGLNIGAGLTFVSTGIAVALMKQRA